MRLRAILTAFAVFATASAATSQEPPPPGGTPGALAIIVHRSNPVEKLTLMELRRIFMFDTQTWNHGRKITVMMRQEGQPERAEAIRLISGLSEEEYNRYILLQRFRGVINQGPREILSAGAMLRFVFNAPGAIGYVFAGDLDGSTKVLRIDDRLPDDPQYPLRRRAPPQGPGRK